MAAVYMLGRGMWQLEENIGVRFSLELLSNMALHLYLMCNNVSTKVSKRHNVSFVANNLARVAMD